MKSNEIAEVEKYFKMYSEGKYYSYFGKDGETGRKFFHKGEDNFHIIIFDTVDSEVYQLNSDHEIQGIELDTLESLKVRFKSFTGEELTNIIEGYDE